MKSKKVDSRQQGLDESAPEPVPSLTERVASHQAWLEPRSLVSQEQKNGPGPGRTETCVHRLPVSAPSNQRVLLSHMEQLLTSKQLPAFLWLILT